MDLRQTGFENGVGGRWNWLRIVCSGGLKLRVVLLEITWTYATGRENFRVHFSTISSQRGIAPGYGLDDRGSRVRFPVRAGNCSLHHRVQTALEPTQPPVQWIPGALSLGIKRLGREADHSPPSSAEVKEWVEL
jgi:hypothetical protein